MVAIVAIVVGAVPVVCAGVLQAHRKIDDGQPSGRSGRGDHRNATSAVRACRKKDAV